MVPYMHHAAAPLRISMIDERAPARMLCDSLGVSSGGALRVLAGEQASLELCCP